MKERSQERGLFHQRRAWLWMQYSWNSCILGILILLFQAPIVNFVMLTAFVQDFFQRKRDFSMNSVTRKTFLKVQLFWHVGICLAWYMFGLILWNDHDVQRHFYSTSEKALLHRINRFPDRIKKLCTLYAVRCQIMMRIIHAEGYLFQNCEASVDCRSIAYKITPSTIYSAHAPKRKTRFLPIYNVASFTEKDNNMAPPKYLQGKQQILHWVPLVYCQVISQTHI